MHKIKAIFFDYVGTLDNLFGHSIVQYLKDYAEIVIVSNSIDSMDYIEEIFSVPVVNPVLATRYIPNVVNIIDYVPHKIMLMPMRNTKYIYPNKIDRIICTGAYHNTNENFLLPFIPKLFKQIRSLKNIDTVFKPHETIFHVARLLLSQPYQWNEILMIGDSYHNDIVGALKLGMQTILVKKDHNMLLQNIKKFL